MAVLETALALLHSWHRNLRLPVHYNSNVRCEWRGVSNQSMQTDPGKELDSFSQLLYCSESLPQPDTADSITAPPIPPLSNQPLALNLPATQPFLTPTMRAVLMDWIMDVCACYSLRRDTYYLAVMTVDRYLSLVPNVLREDYQLVGLAALYIACKSEEITVNRLEKFTQVAGHSYTPASILRMERAILRALQWRLYQTSPFALLYWLTWQWDQFLAGNQSEIAERCCTDRCLMLFQQLDVVYMDINALEFREGQLPLGLLFLHICAVTDYESAERGFRAFVGGTGLVETVEELFPVLEFLAAFQDVPIVHLSTDFLVAQHHNDAILPYIRRKLRPNIAF